MCKHFATGSSSAAMPVRLTESPERLARVTGRVGRVAFRPQGNLNLRVCLVSLSLFLQFQVKGCVALENCGAAACSRPWPRKPKQRSAAETKHSNKITNTSLGLTGIPDQG